VEWSWSYGLITQNRNIFHHRLTATVMGLLYTQDDSKSCGQTFGSCGDNLEYNMCKNNCPIHDHFRIKALQSCTHSYTFMQSSLHNAQDGVPTAFTYDSHYFQQQSSDEWNEMLQFINVKDTHINFRYQGNTVVGVQIRGVPKDMYLQRTTKSKGGTFMLLVYTGCSRYKLQMKIC
jgi:hypothetical protein